MGPNLKSSGYFAGTAFLIAGLTGALAGVGLGVIFLRALLGAFVFGGFGYLAFLVISRRIPELLTTTDGSASALAGSPPETGGHVDIVVDDEDEEAQPVDEVQTPDSAIDIGTSSVDAPATGPSAAEAGGDEDAATLEELGDEEEETPSEGPPRPVEELVEEVTEVGDSGRPGTSGGGTGRGTGTGGGTGDSRGAGGEPAPNPPAASAADEVDDDSLDSLPDIGGFAGSFEGEGSETTEEEEVTGGAGKRDGGHGVDQDPEVIAKALQTVMKRDE
ncbi:MAG: hypothetical protein ACLFUM_00450 [Spirochaetaceae bacterium]